MDPAAVQTNPWWGQHTWRRDRVPGGAGCGTDAVPPHSYASYLVWNDLGGCSSKAIVPLGLYGAQLVLNWAWPPLFFGARNLNMVMGIPCRIRGALGLGWGDLCGCTGSLSPAGAAPARSQWYRSRPAAPLR